MRSPLDVSLETSSLRCLSINSDMGVRRNSNSQRQRRQYQNKDGEKDRNHFQRSPIHSFSLKDETGSVQVNPDAADIEMTSVVNEFQPEQPRGEMLSFGGFSLDISRYTRQASRRTLGYRYRETVLPLERHVLVVGTVSDETNTLESSGN
ncbi:MAG: hypothetical protein F6K30_28355 [Cyanothece sp. SIO2G6]|nr:hypothetical protein [Cyanothece sp. SIO2G6]